LLGNNVFSPNTDVSLTSSLGVAWRAGIDGVLPIWTFGKITNLWDAASANVKVVEADVEKSATPSASTSARLIFGLQLARDSLGLLRDVKGALEKGRTRIKKNVETAEGDPVDLAKLETYASEIEVRESEGLRYVDVALAGLRFYAGVPDLDIPEAPLAMPRHHLGHVSRYLSAAALYRPEVQMARRRCRRSPRPGPAGALGPLPGHRPRRSGRRQRRSRDRRSAQPVRHRPGQLLPLRRRHRLPVEARLPPPGGPDPVRRGPARGGPLAAALRSRRRRREVEIAYAEVLDWQKRVDIYTRAVAAAKRWLVLVQQGIDLGAREDKELLEPAKEFALRKYGQLNAMMELDMAMSRLAKATGWDAIAPDGT